MTEIEVQYIHIIDMVSHEVEKFFNIWQSNYQPRKEGEEIMDFDLYNRSQTTWGTSSLFTRMK